MTSSSSLYGTITTQNASSTNSTGLYGGADTPIPDSSGNVIVRGDLWVLSGNILTTATTGNIFPANATTINLGLAATAVNIGANSGTTTINNALVSDSLSTGPITASTITGTTITGTSFIGDSADFGNITIAVADDNTITTTTGNLKLQSATGNLQFAADTGFLYPEGGSPFNRPYFQSTTGNSSGLRAVAPNTGTSSSAALTSVNSSDTQNAQILSVQAFGSAITDPLRIVSGKYTSGTFGPSGESIAFKDGTTTYATTNPAGPSADKDLTTVEWVENYITSGSFVFQQINIDDTAFIDTATATLNVGTGQVLDSWAITTYGSVKYQIQARTPAGVTQVSEAIVLNDGSTIAYINEYGVISSGFDLYNTLTVDTNSGNVRVLVDVNYASTTFKVVRTAVVA